MGRLVKVQTLELLAWRGGEECRGVLVKGARFINWVMMVLAVWNCLKNIKGWVREEGQVSIRGDHVWAWIKVERVIKKEVIRRHWNRFLLDWKSIKNQGIIKKTKLETSSVCCSNIISVSNLYFCLSSFSLFGGYILSGYLALEWRPSRSDTWLLIYLFKAKGFLELQDKEKPSLSLSLSLSMRFSNTEQKWLGLVHFLPLCL